MRRIAASLWENASGPGSLPDKPSRANAAIAINAWKAAGSCNEGSNSISRVGLNLASLDMP
jgi:hypothetical protein